MIWTKSMYPCKVFFSLCKLQFSGVSIMTCWYDDVSNTYRNLKNVAITYPWKICPKTRVNALLPAPLIWDLIGSKIFVWKIRNCCLHLCDCGCAICSERYLCAWVNFISQLIYLSLEQPTLRNLNCVVYFHPDSLSATRAPLPVQVISKTM